MLRPLRAMQDRAWSGFFPGRGTGWDAWMLFEGLVW